MLNCDVANVYESSQMLVLSACLIALLELLALLAEIPIRHV